MANDTGRSYDEVPYGDGCFRVSQPDHLAALAAVHGIPAPPLERCRVLELGCGSGGNLLPMALELPEASFVGVDLSEVQIASARERASALGARNADFRAMDLAAIDASFGTFDYVVCHGVYSWVPEAVQERILEICSANLSPDGLAYVSYNTFPGWHERRMARGLMLYHDRAGGPSAERIARARSFPGELTRVVLSPEGAYGRILRAEAEALKGEEDAYVFHEFLEDVNRPTYVHEFLTRAARHGLEFVTEAGTPGLFAGLPAPSREAVERWAVDVISREQYLDFVCNRPFRKTVLRHAGGPPAGAPDPAALAGLDVSSDLKPAPGSPVAADESPARFTRPDVEGGASTTSPLLKAILLALDAARPRALDPAALHAAVAARLAEAGKALPADREEAEAELRGAVLLLFLPDLVELHVRPPRPAAGVSARPLASPLARHQAARSSSVTSLRRRVVEVGELERAVLLELDGSRDLSGVLDRVTARVLAGEVELSLEGRTVHDPAVARAALAAEIEPAVRALAEKALLAG